MGEGGSCCVPGKSSSLVSNRFKLDAPTSRNPTALRHMAHGIVYGIWFLDMGMGKHQARITSKPWTLTPQGPLTV